MTNLILFSWICLRYPIIWKSILRSFNICKNAISEKLNKDLFFNEIKQIKIFLNLKKKMSECKVNNTSIKEH